VQQIATHCQLVLLLCHL